MDVSGWEGVASRHSCHSAVSELDRPIDLTGHVLYPFFLYQKHWLSGEYISFNSTFNVLPLHLTDFPTPKFVTIDWIQQWRTILMDIYSHLCLTDESVRAALIATGPRPFKLHCAKPWGYVPNDPDTRYMLHHTAARADLISDIIIAIRVRPFKLHCAKPWGYVVHTVCAQWLKQKRFRPGTRNAAASLAVGLQAQK